MQTKAREIQPGSLSNSPRCWTIIDETIILYALIKNLPYKALKLLYKLSLMHTESATLFPPVLVCSVLHSSYFTSCSKATLPLQVCRRDIHPLPWQVS